VKQLLGTKNKLLTLSHPCDLARQTRTSSPTSASSGLAILKPHKREFLNPPAQSTFSQLTFSLRWYKPSIPFCLPVLSCLT